MKRTCYPSSSRNKSYRASTRDQAINAQTQLDGRSVNNVKTSGFKKKGEAKNTVYRRTSETTFKMHAGWPLEKDWFPRKYRDGDNIYRY